MIVWISHALVMALHDRQLAEHGGSTGLRDDHLLESSLAKPQQLYAYGDPLPDLADLAASLAYGIARNHPFVDGNKRTAQVAYRTFIALNDGGFDASAEEKYLTILAFAEGKLKQAEFAAWLRLHIRLGQGTPSVQEPKKAYRKPPR
jgi:death-on-curing protein